MLRRISFYSLVALGIFLLAQNYAYAATVYQWDNPSYPYLYPTPTVLGETTVAEADALATEAPEPAFAVTAPQGGEVWRAGETYAITWTNPTYLNNYLRYLKAVHVATGATININDGDNLNLLEGGKISWTVPSDWPLSGKFKIRVGVQPESDATPYTDSGIINIEAKVTTPPSTLLAVTAPQIGSVWQPGETHGITWTNSTSLNTGKQKIQAVHVSTGTILNITDSNTTKTLADGVMSWTIPTDLPVFGDFKIRVGTQLADNTAPYADSGVIKIEKSTTGSDITPPVKAALIVTAPKGGEVWKAGETHTITWSTPWFLLNYLRYLSAVEVSSGSTLNINDGNNLKLLEDGTMNWTIPADWPLSGQFKIRVGVQPAGYNTPYDDSEIITIEALPSTASPITVTSPKVGDNWLLGSKHVINWQWITENPILEADPVKITLGPPASACLDSIPPCLPLVVQSYTIAESALDTGTYSWTVPAELSAPYLGTQVITVTKIKTNISGKSSQFTIGVKTESTTTSVSEPIKTTTALDLAEITADATAASSGVSAPASMSTSAQASALDTAKTLVKKLDAKTATVESTEIKMTVEEFIAYGTSTTYKLGAGERAGVVASFVEAFDKLPSTSADWQDVIKIANGRWPTLRSTTQETAAAVSFKEIYKREPQRDISKYDDAALVVMAYGLRPATRSLVNEAAAIKSFTYEFGHAPSSTQEWDIARAIAYSGASRELKVTNEPDADQDGLSDADEIKYKTDPKVADTDADGYTDGIEVQNGYNPLGAGLLSQ